MSANDELQAHTCEKMLEFYGKPQDYVKKSHNEQTLTEQWKKGELKKGKRYWCKLQDGKSEICYLWLQTNHFTSLTGYLSRCLPDEDIVEVLAPLSSFEEWQELKLHDEKATIKLGEKIIENDKLKELLKRCRDFINYEVPDHCIDDVLIDKIDEALK